MDSVSFNDLDRRFASGSPLELSALLPAGIQDEIGHFNVFNVSKIRQTVQDLPTQPYQCRTFYKISLLIGHSKIGYPDGIKSLSQPTLVFTTPKSPITWLPMERQSGMCCVFTPEFLHPTRSGVVLDELPIYKSPEHPLFPLEKADVKIVKSIYEKMHTAIASTYAYKYDLLRTYTLELIHFGQQLQSTIMPHPNHSNFARTTSLFIELLERQFPLDNPHQQIKLRTAGDYAKELSIHVNHLNKILKETTGLTTSALIAGRILKEAQILLRQTNWTIAEIADSLGFSDFAHFAKFFKNETSIPPGTYRSQAKSLNYT
ncbi:helix-turn-helix domain-containing protein [Chitinophaga filiformis]|uniref:helix-turn-helix domain-containing protein n=1 Tax=Chitinophaga filiformis TaxID=104663 RepID=UPI001F3D5358|nr:helix-turn-helix domain-containing protein [Chitinophaga filiformis]MCF6403726.1 helix-turn-helix domain-containing protein [Chitinophaga filiformis]